VRRSILILLAGALPAVTAPAAHAGLVFSTPVTYATHDLPSSVAVGSVVGSGFPDIVVANTASGDVSVLRTNQDGTFKAAQNYATGGAGPVAVSLYDTSFRGVRDIAVANYTSGTVALLTNQGNGSFQVPCNTGSVACTSNPTLWSVPGSPLWAAFLPGTEDSPITDLYEGLDGATGIYREFNLFDPYTPGPPAFGAASGSLASVPLSPVGAVVGDFLPADPWLAVAVASTTGTVTILRADGSGGFGGGTPQTITFPYSISAITTADFNKDGIPDIAVSSLAGYACVVLLDGAGSTKHAPACYPVPGAPRGVAAGDVTADGNADIVTANSNDHSIAILAGTGTGSFAGAVRFATADTSSPWSVAISDLRNNGANDIVTADRNTPNGTVSVFLAAAAPHATPTSVAFGEQDGLVSSTPQTITITNTGAAPFTVLSVVAAGPHPDSYTYNSACANPITPGASCAITIAFRPFGLGPVDATLEIDTGTTGVLAVPLRGIGVIPGAPQITSLALTPRVIHRASAFAARYTITRTATITITITVTLTGRRVGRRCLVTTHAVTGKRCRVIRTVRTLTAHATLGKNTTIIQRARARAALAAGSYQLTVTATDPFHRRSGASRLALRIRP
jgi:hypothetical protein